MVGSMPFISQQLTIVGRNGMLHYALLEYISQMKYIFMHGISIYMYRERDRQHKRWTSLKGQQLRYTPYQHKGGDSEQVYEESQNTEGVGIGSSGREYGMRCPSFGRGLGFIVCKK